MNMELNCVLMVLDDQEILGKIRREVFRKLKVPITVVLQNDYEQMQKLDKMGKCGVFVQFHKEER